MTNRKFGIEIEAYNIDRQVLATALNQAGIYCTVEGYNHTNRPHWKLVTDCTINGAKSFELVSPPLAGEAGLEQIKTVCRVLNQLKAKVNKSCGLHVHHDANDLNLDNFKNLFNLYYRFESTLDSLLPESRRADNNRFCHSLVTKIEGIRNARTLEEIRTAAGTRYNKLNIESYWRHGTIEVRHHSGTVDAAKIINWIQLTQLMVERSKSRVSLSEGRTESNLGQLKKVLTRNLEENFTQLFTWLKKRQSQVNGELEAT